MGIVEIFTSHITSDTGIDDVTRMLAEEMTAPGAVSYQLHTSSMCEREPQLHYCSKDDQINGHLSYQFYEEFRDARVVGTDPS